MKYFLFLISLFLLAGCEKRVTQPIAHPNTLTFDCGCGGDSSLFGGSTGHLLIGDLADDAPAYYDLCDEMTYPIDSSLIGHNDRIEFMGQPKNDNK